MPVGLWNGFLGAGAAIALVLALAGPAGASPVDPDPARPGCGVRLLSQGVLISGVDASRGVPDLPGLPDQPIDEVIDDVVAGIVSSSGPATAAVICQPVPGREELARAEGGRCKNADTSGATLKRRLAAKAVRCLINKQRGKRGIGDLRPSEDLKKAAKGHSRKMLKSGCFDHQCAGERELVGRVVESGYLPCGCSWTIGENIAWGARRLSTPSAIVKAWMASPGHRDIILTREFEQVDIGVARGKPGNARARAATYTADFGRRD